MKMHITRRFQILMCLPLSAAGGGAVASTFDDLTQHAASTHKRTQADFPLPAPENLSATTLSGSAVDLKAKPGWKVIYFWSAECPCVTACEKYSFVPLEKKYHGKVAFYGIVSGRYDLEMSSQDLAKEVLHRHLPYSVLLDKDHSVALALNARVTPQTFVLDPDNRVVFAGMADDSRRYIVGGKANGVQHTYLSEALDQALAGKPVAQPTNTLEGCIVSW
jgi:peroxiredoxin